MGREGETGRHGEVGNGSGCKAMADQQAVKREVFAVQAFLDKHSEDRIMRICDGVLAIEGIDCSFPLGMFPHFTIGSWWATASEFEEANPIFAERLASLDAIEASVELEEREKSETTSYFLAPEVTDQLLQFHVGIHQKLGYLYEPYREIDLPGSWWPHLKLFTIPKDEKCLIEKRLARFRDITTVRIVRLGLVTFYPRIVTVREVPLRSEDNRCAPAARAT